MAFESKVRDIKKAQKEKLIFRELSQIFWQLFLDDTRLSNLQLTRVSLSADKSTCFIFFYIPGGLTAFEEKLDILKLYKGSLRKAMADQIDARYTPELVFKFDELHEKQQHIENLFESIKKTEG